jgi:hypothetical protein
MNEPKTWSRNEVLQLMIKEMHAYKEDCRIRRRDFSYKEMADNVYSVLCDNGLIELQP